MKSINPNMTKIVLGLILISFLANLVTAQPPFEQQQSFEFIETGLLIKYPQVFYFKQGEDINFRIKVFNNTNGLELDNSSVGCTFFFTNPNGSNYFYKSMTYYDKNYNVTVNGENFSSVGEYGYGFYCNTSNKGGFVSTELKITPTGYELTEAQGITLLGINLSVLLLGFLFMGIGYKLSGEEKFIPITFIFFVLAIIMGIYSLHLNYAYAEQMIFYEGFSGTPEVMYITVLWLMTAIVIITGAMMLIAFIRELGRMNDKKTFGDDFNPLTNTYE